MNTALAPQGLLERLTQTIFLDRVLKILGVAGFVLTFFHAWRGIGLASKLGFICSVAAWYVGARFTKIYR